MGVVSWIALGAPSASRCPRASGAASPAAWPERWPGKLPAAGGTAGGFPGGGIFTLAGQRGTSGLDPTALGLAVIGAVLILTAAGSAGYVDPGPR